MKRYDDVAGFVLAGGASTRMGRDKALLELGGVPMLVRMAQLVGPFVTSVAVVAPRERYVHLGLRLVVDGWPGTGPLGGIATALGKSSMPWNLIVACDLPYLTAEWVEWLISRALESSAQAIVPESRHGLEPLAAMYRKDCAATFNAAIERGVRSISEALGELVCERVRPGEWYALDSTDSLFDNMNTPEDFAKAYRLLMP